MDDTNRARLACSLFARQVEPSPEANLFLAILFQAIHDATFEGKTEKKEHRASAIRYFKNGVYRRDCDLLELDADWVAEVLVDYGVLEPSVFNKLN